MILLIDTPAQNLDTGNIGLEQTILEMRAITKRFAGVIANDHIDFDLNAGEIHALLGENGAGKTTLMNILYGLYKPDEGEIYIRGRKVEIASPRESIDEKIGMVHQHLTLVPVFTVLQNLILGRRRGGKFSLALVSKEERNRILESCEKFGLDIPLSAKVKELPMGVRQRVEIARTLYRGAEILILDEPTASLAPHEVDRLFDSLQTVVKKGLSIVFITHKVREALSVSDRITVLREGKVHRVLNKKDATTSSLVKAMVGEKIDVSESVLYGKFGESARPISRSEKPVLAVQDAWVHGPEETFAVKNCSFEVYGGEIFGIAGVSGNGQKELADAIIKLREVEKGSITISGKNVKNLSTSEILDSGLAYVPEDRIGEGSLPSASVAENLILGYHRHKPISRKKFFLDWLDLEKLSSISKELISQYDIKTPNEKAFAMTLSGGNIQKMMLARAFSRPAKLLIAYDPTKGLDVALTDFVLKQMDEFKKKGTAILWICEDLDQLISLSDRVGVIYEGEIVGVLKREQFDKYKIGKAMTGVERI
ncbi:MAG: ABC transporter ATP-binding protein [Aigarchaeota archaeon]|nr:ABC transporter ATP-binding protein [Aigarchaeota archaeon]